MKLENLYTSLMPDRLFTAKSDLTSRIVFTETPESKLSRHFDATSSLTVVSRGFIYKESYHLIVNSPKKTVCGRVTDFYRIRRWPSLTTFSPDL